MTYNLILPTYKLAKNLGLNRKNAYKWAKNSINDEEYLSNVEKVAVIFGCNHVLLDRIVTASHQKNDFGESILIGYLDGNISHKEFSKWFNKYYKMLIKGIKDGKKWAITGRVSHPVSKKTGKYVLPYGATLIYKKLKKEKERQSMIAIMGKEGYNDWLLENNPHVHPILLKFAI